MFFETERARSHQSDSSIRKNIQRKSGKCFVVIELRATMPSEAAYRSRPGGSAEGGVEGLAGSEPEFAETLLGAG